MNIKRILITGAFDGGGGGDVYIGKMKEYWVQNNITVEKLFKHPFKFTLNAILNPFATLKTLRKETKLSHEFDLIIASSPYFPDIMAAIVFRLKYRNNCVVYFHHLPPPIYWNILKIGFIRLFINNILSLFSLTCSKILGMVIFLEQPKAYRIGNAITMKNECAIDDEFKQYLESLTDEKIYDLCYIGRISRSKGVIDILSSASIIKKSHMNLKICIAGYIENQKFFEKVQKKIIDLNLNENVTMFNNIENSFKANLIKSSRVFIFPSYIEGWALSVMEAAAGEVPIVAYDLPAYSYLKGNFFAVKPGNVKQFAAKIIECLSDYPKSLEIAKKAKIEVSKYNYKQIAEDQLRFFNDFINNQ